MSDLISRTGAIAHFDKVAEELDEQRGDDSWVGNAFKICLLGVVNDLAVLPSAEPQWIPVSERLPERGKDVLVTRKYYGKDDFNKDSIYVEISACYADGEEWHGYSDEYKMSPKNHKVIAWMPLPPSYEGGETV